MASPSIRRASAIQAELERSGFRQCFAFESRWAIQPLDLLRELRKLKPTVVHFSGRAPAAPAAALAEAFGAAGTSVKLVVLNTCYTDALAEALLAHVDCVVGMSGASRDNAAKSFAIGFYGGLGEREPIAAAFQRRSAGSTGSRASSEP